MITHISLPTILMMVYELNRSIHSTIPMCHQLSPETEALRQGLGFDDEKLRWLHQRGVAQGRCGHLHDLRRAGAQVMAGSIPKKEGKVGDMDPEINKRKNM